MVRLQMTDYEYTFVGLMLLIVAILAFAGVMTYFEHLKDKKHELEKVSGRKTPQERHLHRAHQPGREAYRRAIAVDNKGHVGERKSGVLGGAVTRL